MKVRLRAAILGMSLAAIAHGAVGLESTSRCTREHIEPFGLGYRAIVGGRFNEARYWLLRAMEARKQIGGRYRYRISGRNYVYYQPRFFLGIAYFGSGDYSVGARTLASAREEWKISGASDVCRENRTPGPDDFRDFDEVVMVLQELSDAIGQVQSTVNEMGGHAGEWHRRGTVLLSRAFHESAKFCSLLVRESHQGVDPRISDRLRLLASDLSQFARDFRRSELDRGSAARENGGGGRSVERAAWAWNRSDRPILASMSLGRAVAMGAIVEPPQPGEEGLYSRKSAIFISPLRWARRSNLLPYKSLVLERFQTKYDHVLKSLGFDARELFRPSGGGKKDGLMKHLRRFADEATCPPSTCGVEEKGKNLLLVFYAGHGCEIPEPIDSSQPGSHKGGGRTLLVLPLTRFSRPCPGRTEGISKNDFNEFVKEGLVASDFLSALAGRPNHHILLFIDGCNAAELVQEIQRDSTLDEGIEARRRSGLRYYAATKNGAATSWKYPAFLMAGPGGDVPLDLASLSKLLDLMGAPVKLNRTGHELLSELEKSRNLSYPEMFIGMSDDWSEGDIVFRGLP